jgi:hypothetical protein
MFYRCLKKGFERHFVVGMDSYSLRDKFLKLNIYRKQKFYLCLRHIYDTLLFYGCLKRGFERGELSPLTLDTLIRGGNSRRSSGGAGCPAITASSG